MAALEAQVARLVQPIGRDRLEVGRAHAGMRGHDELDQPFLAPPRSLEVVIEHRLERLPALALRLPGVSTLTRSRAKSSRVYIGCST